MAALSTTSPLTRDSVIEAHKIVKQHVHRTPVVTNSTLSLMASTPRTVEELNKDSRWAGRTPARPVLRFWFKCENLQRIGAFKVRGAFHALDKLLKEPRWVEGGGKERGVVTHSSGKKMCWELWMGDFVSMSEVENLYHEVMIICLNLEMRDSGLLRGQF